MNTEAFDRFAEAYRAGLLAAVEASPEDYAVRHGQTPREYAEKTADFMLRSIEANPRSVNYGGGGGFKRACRTLGIKYTRKAIWEYLGVAP
jgi:hypothetical protein